MDEFARRLLRFLRPRHHMRCQHLFLAALALLLFLFLSLTRVALHARCPSPHPPEHSSEHPEMVAAWRSTSVQTVPPKIWQIVLSKTAAHDERASPRDFRESATWLAMNPGYSYTVMDDKAALAFVQEYYRGRPEILEAYTNMPNVGMKSDLLRYLILGAEGGVYTDTDTIALRPVDIWVPPKFRARARLVIGIEYDRLDGDPLDDMLHWVQFCQWTIAAAPGHPVFARMIIRVLEALHDLEATYALPLWNVAPTSPEIMNSTGPAAWTETVFKVLQNHDPGLADIKSLSHTTEPRLIGDVLILPINGFGMGQEHSSSARSAPPEDALVRHLFRGSWRGNHIGQGRPPS